VFGEAGFGLEHTWWNATYPGGNCNTLIYGPNCEFSTSDFGAFPYFHGGGRFLFGDTVGLLVRIGYPYVTLGVSILL